MSDPHSNISSVRRRPRASFRQGRPEAESRSRWARERADREEEPRSRRSARGRETESEYEYDCWDRPETRRALPYYGPEEEEPSGFRFPFDPWRLLGAVRRNWGWILTGAALLAVMGILAGMVLVNYKVTVPLLRKQTPNAFQAEATAQFGVRDYSDQTIYAFMRSGDLLHRVAARAATNENLAPLGVTPRVLANHVSINPSPNPDVVMLSMGTFGELPRMVELANIYADEVVHFTRELQQREALGLTQYLREKLAQAHAEVTRASLELRTNFSMTGFGDFDSETEAELRRLRELREQLVRKQIERDALTSRIAAVEEHLQRVRPANTQLETAREELRQLLVEYRPAHPAVIAKQAQISALERLRDEAANSADGPPALASTGLDFNRMIDLSSNLPGIEAEIQYLTNNIQSIEQRLSGTAETGVHYAMKKGELDSLAATQSLLASKARQAELLADNAMGYFDLMAPATMNNIDFSRRWLKVGLLGFGAGLVGLVASLGLVLLTEAMDTTLKTREDVTRVTGLPVLAALGDLRSMSPEEQVKWAFRTLTILKGKLTSKPDEAMVCGIISSTHGEGRSTWVNLLVSAASQRGLRVLTVDTRPAAEAPQTNESAPRAASKEPAAPAAEPAPAPPAENPPAPPASDPERNGHEAPPMAVDQALASNALSDPQSVTDQLATTTDQPMVHIPLPGWVWNLERRKQWQKALDYWKQVENLVIFVELPPASESEAVLLSEHVPQLIWLTGSGMADAADTATHLETLRHAQCNLVGAVLNQAPPPMVNARIARWFTRMTASALLSLGLLQPAYAQVAAEPPPSDEPAAEARQLTFSANPRKERAAWQQRLTFGPGDTMDISVFDRPALTRTNVFVGPDGRISYLQVQGLSVSGLTVEEVRERLDEALSEYYTGARSIVIPVAYTSKKYYMLGKVTARGVYPMDRPLTLIEAVARARGLETGMYQRHSVDMADLSRSFIVRNGEKLPVDFQKLFLNGDLSQNVTLEPEDYVFFAAAAVNNIYVLGEVMLPGPIGFIPNVTVVSALTDRGGFTERAYRGKVLVVRGSLHEPETFVINVREVLDGVQPDFALQSGDIVFVRNRPWIKAEELADEAVQSFIQGAVTTWAGINVGPIIKKEIFPSRR